MPSASFWVLALLHRYKGNRDGTGFDTDLLGLLPAAQVTEAETLGRADALRRDVRGRHTPPSTAR